jgi:vacuolar-type H+-ATPase subunit I/STV1
LDIKPIMCVHGRMSMHPEPGQKAPKATASGLRRRVIFELDPEQLPLLEAVRERHGSTRAGLVAALEAETGAQELRQRAEAAEERLQRAERAAKRREQGKASAKHQDEALAKRAERERELAAELKSARKEHAEAEKLYRQEEEGYEEALEELKEELSDLQARAVDWLFCARCGEWVAPEDWAWQRIESGGRYAYHRDCGDHKPGLLPSSWLAQRA